jgi:hypothetical protein
VKPYKGVLFEVESVHCLRRKIDIRRLKRFALEHLPRDSPLRDVLLAEEDELSVQDFLAKMDLWLKLLRREPS